MHGKRNKRGKTDENLVDSEIEIANMTSHKLQHFQRLEFPISVMASVTAYYICKWLDRDD